MKEKITKWFQQGLWTETMVQNAVTKGILTKTEATKIIKGGSK